MNIVKSFLMGLVMLSLSYSANVTISGTVTDTAGVAISGAEVKLLVGGQNTTTGSNGSFTLLGNNVGITVKPAQSQSYQPVVSLTKGILKLHIQEQSSVNILTYNLQGSLLTSMHKTLSAGDHSIALTNRSSGVYLYKIQINNNDYQIMSNSLYSYATPANTTQGTSSYSLSKQAKTLTAINDTLRVRKDGYSDYLVPVHTSDTSGITVKMHLVLTVKDADGNIYHIVTIGTQTWMVENLRTTKYNDGTAIPNVTNTTTWDSLTTPGYCWYNNDATTNMATYGALYNWYTVNTGKLAPAGWHVPTDAEWDTLQNYLIANGYNYDGTITGDKIAKSMAAQTNWSTSNYTGSIGNNVSINNRSGFSAVPGGCRDDGGFRFVGSNGYWWSDTECYMLFAYLRYLGCHDSYLGSDPNYKCCGFSVRLLRN